MKFYPGKIYHVYNRGNNRQRIFFEKRNYYFFLEKMKKHLLNHSDLLAWCLMPNHFHWMIKIKDDYLPKPTTISESNEGVPSVEVLNRSISVLLSSYTKAINNKYKRSGSLFKSRTQSKNLNKNESIDDDYPLICFLYIHQNPLKAKLVNRMQDWKFSSFQDYSGFRNGALCNRSMAKELLELPRTNEEFLKLSEQTIPKDKIRRIL